MFFGWYVVAGTFTAQLLVVGFFSYSVSLLVGPVREEFGVSMEQVLYSMSLGTLFCVYTAVLSILGHYATDLGYRPEQAASLIMILAISGLVGKLLFGLLADRLNLKFGLWAAIGLVAVAFVLLALEPVWPLVVMLGLAAGGMLPVWGSMMAKGFGLVSYGKAMGLMGPVITLAVFPGFTLMGRLYDLSGSYQLGISVCAGVTVLAAVLLIPLRLEGAA